MASLLSTVGDGLGTENEGVVKSLVTLAKNVECSKEPQ